MPREWTFESHAQSLVERWEQGKLTADEVVRELRTTLREEAAIREAESK